MGSGRLAVRAALGCPVGLGLIFAVLTGRASAATADSVLGDDKVDTIIPGRIRTELTNYNLSLEYDFEWATLQSSTTWSDFEVEFDQDFDGLLAGVFPGFVIATRTSSTENGGIPGCLGAVSIAASAKSV